MMECDTHRLRKSCTTTNPSVPSPPPRGGTHAVHKVPNEKTHLALLQRLVLRTHLPFPPRLGPWLPLQRSCPAALSCVVTASVPIPESCHAMLTRPRRERGPACTCAALALHCAKEKTDEDPRRVPRDSALAWRSTFSKPFQHSSFPGPGVGRPWLRTAQHIAAYSTYKNMARDGPASIPASSSGPLTGTGTNGSAWAMGNYT